MDPKNAIEVEGLWKTYSLYRKPLDRLRERMPWNRGRKFHAETTALQDINLTVAPGQCIGVIGGNGAGKSTLLKILTGTTYPTRGSYTVRGKVAALLELGAGFHQSFSGHENIFMNAAMMGFSRKEAQRKYHEIVEFSELGDFIDRPVKTYSSGMYVRLGFAVAASVDPDILMIDEALSVGDEHFKGKCINRLNEFREQGKTTIFVSHDMGSVKSMCQHVVLMDKGEVLEQGNAEKVADEYLKRAKSRGNERLSALNRGTSAYPRWGTGEIETHEVEMLDSAGTPGFVFRTNEPFRVRVRYRVLREAKNPVFGIGLYRSDGTYVNGANHHWRETPIVIERAAPGEEGVVEMAFERMPLLAGQYYVTTFLYDHSKAAPTAIDHREHAVTFEVVDDRRHQHGMLYLPCRWSIERATPAGAVREESKA